MIDRNLRIVFMGTPDFAVPSLQILLEAGYNIVGVITAPDKTGGRGLKNTIVSPVKSFALSNGLKVLQPENLKSKKFIEELISLKADLQVVVAFRMLPEVIWQRPPLGTMNLHGSLLPAYRGAAPIQWAIINGEKVTGLTTFMLQHEIDTGQIISKREMPILNEDDAGTLHDRMMIAGAELVLGSVDLISSGKIKLTEQDDLAASHAPKITHQAAHILWNQPPGIIYNFIRGLSPFPGAWSVLDGMEMKILKSVLFSKEEKRPVGSLVIENKKLIAQAREGELELLEVQLAGKRRMSATGFINGYKIKAGLMT